MEMVGGGGYKEVEYWFRKAAEQGFASAQFNLGLMYDKGQYVKQDYTEAAKWYRKAAEQNHIKAQYALGYMYRDGKGVPKDEKEFFKWIGKADMQREWPRTGWMGAVRAIFGYTTGYFIMRMIRSLW